MPPSPNDSDPADQSEQKQVQRIKVPAFMETPVAGWFGILNAQFNLNRITKNKTKFYHALVALPPDTVFPALKEAVSSMYERTKPELFERLISKASTSVTGRPSLFLAELRDIVNKVGVGDELVRHKFLQCVDPSIAAVLAAQDIPLQQLGRLADELLPFMKKTGAYMVNSERPTPPSIQPASPRPPSTTNSVPQGVQPFNDGQRP